MGPLMRAARPWSRAESLRMAGLHRDNVDRRADVSLCRYFSVFRYKRALDRWESDKHVEKGVLLRGRLHDGELLLPLELKLEFLVVAVRMDRCDVDAGGKVHPGGVVGTDELVE